MPPSVNPLNDVMACTPALVAAMVTLPAKVRLSLSTTFATARSAAGTVVVMVGLYVTKPFTTTGNGLTVMVVLVLVVELKP